MEGAANAALSFDFIIIKIFSETRFSETRFT